MSATSAVSPGRSARLPMVATPLTRVLGAGAAVTLVATAVLGLWVTPPDIVQGDKVRLLYVHPPLAWVAMLAYGLTAAASALYLWPRTRSRAFDHLAGASAEVGVVFTGLMIVTGSIWGKATWGVWWTWDPLLTSSALLFVLYLGYLALRRAPGDIHKRSRRSAIAALVAFVDVPIVQMSVEWWHSLHQKPTVTASAMKISGIMAWTLLLGFVAFTLLWLWLMVHRFRIEAMAEELEVAGLDRAIEARHAEDLAMPAPVWQPVPATDQPGPTTGNPGRVPEEVSTA